MVRLAGDLADSYKELDPEKYLYEQRFGVELLEEVSRHCCIRTGAEVNKKTVNDQTVGELLFQRNGDLMHLSDAVYQLTDVCFTLPGMGTLSWSLLVELRARTAAYFVEEKEQLRQEAAEKRFLEDQNHKKERQQ